MIHGSVLLAHASRRPDSAAPFARPARHRGEPRSAAQIVKAGMEHPGPTQEAAVVPRRFARGRRVKRELLQIVASHQAQHPSAPLRVLPASGEAEALSDAIAARVAGGGR